MSVNERKILVLQIAQSPEMMEFVVKEIEKLVTDMRNHVKNGQQVEAYADEKLIRYLENLQSRITAFVSK